MVFRSILRCSPGNLSRLMKQPKRNFRVSAKTCKTVADEAGGSRKPTPFQSKILVWTKTYKSASDIPPRITTTQLATALDKFRVMVSLGMLAGAFIASAITMLIGRKQRMERIKEITAAQNRQRIE